MTPGAPPPSRILVVDDQEANIRLLTAMLERLGYEVVTATTGDQALRQVAARAPDLILLDVLMPGLDGFEVCRRVLENPLSAHLPVIFISSADDKDFIVRALGAGGVDYVTKPFHQAELASRVRTHLALKAAQDSLRQLAEDKDELLGILAHDLKSHLGGMQMSAQLLQQRAAALSETRIEQMADNILHATDRMFSFVKEFLANSRAERGFDLKLDPVSLHEVAAAVVRSYAEAARRKDLLLLMEKGGEDLSVLADRAGLGQVLDNLVSNALKFSPPGKTVRVAVEARPGAAVCRVQDDGPGFTEEDRVLMYGRYRRLSAAPTGNEPSTGLGLSIVKKLVLAMGGRLHFESVPGRGSSFSVEFPSA